jgi:hypothetical protein
MDSAMSHLDDEIDASEDDLDEAVVVRHLNYGSWLLRVITWDVILPVCIAFAPMVVDLLLPNHRGAIEVTAVLLPIAAFFLRIRAGERHIASNRCSDGVRRFQFCALCLGILPLILIDCFMILSHLMPRGALLTADSDKFALAIVYALYLSSMAVAMYPGRTISSPVDWDDPTASAEVDP